MNASLEDKVQHQEKRLLLQGWEMEASDQAAVEEQGLG